MTELPAPLVPADADLQDFPFMPLHVARLRDSDLAAEETPEACWYAVLLWAASWHQLPAGSLPDNDRVLMKLVDLGRDERTWKKHKDGALRGFVRCSDGRLYHPVVAEQVNSAWDAKLRQKHRTFCAAVRKHNERNPENKLETPTFEEWVALDRPDSVTATAAKLSRAEPEKVTRDRKTSHADNDRDIGSNRQGQGQGQGQGDSIIDKSSPSGDPPFELELVGGDGEDPDRPLTVDEIVLGWNELAEAVDLPKVVKLTDARAAQAKARMKDFPDLASWQSAFGTIRSSPFLQGRNDRGWKADFDFLIQAKSFPKLVEGSYGQ